MQERRLLKDDSSAELLSVLTERLIAGAGEMFQWVKIQVEYFCQLNHEEDITVALESETLATLEDLYGRILDRIVRGGATSREIAMRAFSWLLHMREALSPEAFLSAAFAQSVKADEVKKWKGLMTICSGLVVFDSRCDTFRFSHQSVQDFLRKRIFSSMSGQMTIATGCLQVCQEGSSHESSLEELDALYKYSALYWAHHCSRAISLDQPAIINEQIISFVCDEPGDFSLSFMGWLHNVLKISKSFLNDHPMKLDGQAIPNLSGSPIFVVSVVGLDSLLGDAVLGVEAIDWEQKNDQGHTCLYLASAAGHVSTARMLPDHKVDPNVHCGRLGNPLQAACFGGHDSIVRELLKHGASAIAIGTFSNALEACFRGQQEASAVTLLTHGDIIITEEDFNAAVGGAANVGFLEVLEHLKKLHFAHENKDKIKAKTARAIQGGSSQRSIRISQRQKRSNEPTSGWSYCNGGYLWTRENYWTFCEYAAGYRG